jgi:cell division protein FtsB
MVVKSRVRAVLAPLAFYVVSGVASSYFVWQASNGDRGRKAGVEYEAQVASLGGELKDLKTERERWERRVALMRSDSVDRDLLDVEARATLDRVGRNDVVIYTGSSAAR